MSSKSRSIPITPNEKILREESDQQRGEMVADFKDLAFCTRLVDGMRKQQLHTQDVGLRYQNQALIDHIIDTRYNSGSYRAVMPHPSELNMQYHHHVVDAVQDALGLVQEDDLIFDMEL